MVAVYLCIGLLFLFTDIAIDFFPSYRQPVGLIMIIYAGFRAFVGYKKMKADKDNEQEN